MNRTDTAALLTVIATYDNRNVDEATVIAWHGILGDLRFDECRDAAREHYSHETTWCMPAHVRKRVLAARQDAAMRSLPPGAGGDLVPKPEWFAGLVAEHRDRIHAANEHRKASGQRPSYGITVTRPIDHQPRGVTYVPDEAESA